MGNCRAKDKIGDRGWGRVGVQREQSNSKARGSGEGLTRLRGRAQLHTAHSWASKRRRKARSWLCLTASTTSPNS